MRGYGRHGGKGHHRGDHHHGRHGEGRMGRLLGHGDLRYVILSLLEEKPRHGYELIKALEDLSSGAYSPSPGAIYPTLTYLEEAGYATATTQDNKKLYALTAEGKVHLDLDRESLNDLLQRFAMAGKRMSQFKHLVGQQETEEIARKEGHSIRGSVHKLKSELFNFVDASKEQKLQIVAIIDRATEEIRKVKG